MCGAIGIKPLITKPWHGKCQESAGRAGRPLARPGPRPAAPDPTLQDLPPGPAAPALPPRPAIYMKPSDCRDPAVCGGGGGILKLELLSSLRTAQIPRGRATAVAGRGRLLGACVSAASRSEGSASGEQSESSRVEDKMTDVLWSWIRPMSCPDDCATALLLLSIVSAWSFTTSYDGADFSSPKNFGLLRTNESHASLNLSVGCPALKVECGASKTFCISRDTNADVSTIRRGTSLGNVDASKNTPSIHLPSSPGIVDTWESSISGSEGSTLKCF